MQNDIPQVLLQAISNDLGSLVRIVKDLDARLSAVEDHVTKPVAKVRDGEQRPIVVRHSRYIDGFGEVCAKGGVTYLFELNYKNRTAKVGVAVCSLKENFNKKMGILLAEVRLKTDPIVFAFDAPSDVGLVDTFWNAVKLDGIRMSRDNQRIINSIKISALV